MKVAIQRKRYYRNVILPRNEQPLFGAMLKDINAAVFTVDANYGEAVTDGRMPVCNADPMEEIRTLLKRNEGYESRSPRVLRSFRVRSVWIQKERWSRLSEQLFRVDKWSLCRV